VSRNQKIDGCGQDANNWIKTVSECIGLYQIKNLRKKNVSREKTGTAMERKFGASEFSIWNKYA
jgi:hypothetical protein